MWYNRYMKSLDSKTYKKTATTVSLIRYHFVFCPKYRRKIFLIPGVEDAFKKHVTEQCEALGIDILAMECHIDHVHMFVSAVPQLSIPEIMQKIKGCTSHTLRDEFRELSGMSSLWTRSYFVSTAGDVSARTIQAYVESQKSKP